MQGENLSTGVNLRKQVWTGNQMDMSAGTGNQTRAQWSTAQRKHLLPPKKKKLEREQIKSDNRLDRLPVGVLFFLVFFFVGDGKSVKSEKKEAGLTLKLKCNIMIYLIRISRMHGLIAD